MRALACYNLDLLPFEREQNAEICASVGLYRRKSDGLEIIAKENPDFDSNDLSFEFLERLTHLKHASIAPLFGIVFPTDSTNLMIATLYYRCGSLKEVLANPPSWWTPTAKSKTIAGIVLGMRFAHSCGCVHGSLKPSNILFDSNHNVRIVDFRTCSFEECVTRESDEEGEVYQTDLVSFALILFAILVDRRVVAPVFQYDEVVICFVDDGERAVIPSFIPSFMRDLIEHECLENESSFDAIYQVLKQNDFDMVEGNDVNEVLRFVGYLEASEYEGK
jgi:serine/threonine protein kinase